MLEVVVGRVGDGKTLYMANKVVNNPDRKFCHIAVFDESIEFFKAIRVLSRFSLHGKGRLSRKNKKALKKAFGDKAFQTWRMYQDHKIKGHSFSSVANLQTLMRVIEDDIQDGFSDFYIDGFDLIDGDKRHKINVIRGFAERVNVTLSLQARLPKCDERFDEISIEEIHHSLQGARLVDFTNPKVEVVTLRRDVGKSNLVYKKMGEDVENKVICLEEYGKVYKNLFKNGEYV